MTDERREAEELVDRVAMSCLMAEAGCGRPCGTATCGCWTTARAVVRLVLERAADQAAKHANLHHDDRYWVAAAIRDDILALIPQAPTEGGE